MKLLPDQRDLLLACLGTLTLVAVAFGHRPPSTDKIASGKSALRFAYFPNLTHSPALVGVQRGEFDRSLSQFQVSPRVVNAGPEAMEALLAGEVDLAYVGPSPAVNTFIKSKGVALSIVSGACSGGASLMARKGVSIRTVADLDGKRVAVPQLGGTQDVSLRHFLSEAGLKPRELRGTVEIIPVKNPDILTLFRQGQIDAAWVPEPWATRLSKEAGAKRAIDERQLWPNGQFTTTVLVARTQFAKSHPQAVTEFIQAHRATVQWINKNPAEAKDSVNLELKRITGKKLSSEVLNEAWARLSFTTAVNEPSIKSMVEAARVAGYLKGPRPDLSALFASKGMAAQ